MANRRKGIAEPNEGSAAINGKFSLISNKKLIALYTNLLKCRRLSRQIGANGASSTIRGHEAILVGTTIDLGMGDTVWFHEHGMLTGFSRDSMIADILLGVGSPTSGAIRGAKAADKNGATSHAHAAIGTALANKTHVNKRVTLVFARDETSKIALGALHIAAVHSLPMVFVHMADATSKHSVGVSERRKKTSGEKRSPWFPHIIVDRDDVVAMYRVANEAIARARLGRGPTFIECVPFRSNGGASARKRRVTQDPIHHMEHYLQTRDLFDPRIKVDVLAQLEPR